MQNKIFLSSVLMLLIVAVNGQPSFKKGYIVSTKGDTLHGYIYFNRINTPLFDLRYRSSARSPEKRISSVDISCYWIKGQGRFISTQVLLSAIDLHEENNAVYPHSVPVVALLKELVKGPYYSLLKMEYEKPRFYISYEDSPKVIEELINIEAPGYFSKQGYKQQLSELLDSEDPTQEQIGHLEYKEAELKRIFIYLNAGHGPITKSKSRLAGWYIGAGLARLAPSMGSHFYTMKKMASCFGVSATVGYTRPWLNLTEKLISGSSLTLTACQSRYQPAERDSAYQGNTHTILLATVATMLTYRFLEGFHYRLCGGLEPYGQVGFFSPTRESAEDKEVWQQIPRKTFAGFMLGLNATAKIELSKFSISGFYTLVTLPSWGDDVTLDCRKTGITLSYFF